jgi:hypothetical protein
MILQVLPAIGMLKLLHSQNLMARRLTIKLNAIPRFINRH